MALHFFAIPALDGAAAEAALNAFCAAKRVVALERRLVEAGHDSFWAICVTVTPGEGPLPAALKSGGGRGQRVDYKELLSDDDFRVFAALRNWRKEAAADAGLQLYNVFTNDQLAAIARQRPPTLGALRKIEGVGAARAERFGEQLLSALARAGKDAPGHGSFDADAGPET